MKAFDDAVIKNTGEGRSKREVNKIEDGLIGSIKRICPLEINGGKNECVRLFIISCFQHFFVQECSRVNTKEIRSLNLFQTCFLSTKNTLKKERLREWEKEGNTFVSVSD